MTDSLASPLVLTKLRVPPSRSRIVPRARLVDQFSPQADLGFILVCAPAGSGKTTLLTQWSKSLLQSDVTVAWYALDPSDNDPIPFGSYLVASLTQALGTTVELENVTKEVRSSPETKLYRIMPAIINAVVSSVRPCVLILDDYQLVSNPEIHSAIAYLLDHLPENMHIIIGSRSDPPLPLARLRAHGRLLELRDADLRFRADETETFLNDIMRLGLSPEVLTTLQTRTEGWIAGLQLAALSLSTRSGPEGLIFSFSGRNPYLFNYLLEEVVGCQPEEVQNFLQLTSILERMCGPLCDAILGKGPHGEMVLSQLDQQNLFVVPLDREGYWYRYHHLFRDFLQTQLQKKQPGLIPLLHRAASEWFASQGSLREAVQHALQSQDWGYAAEVVEKFGMPTLMHSEISTVYEWCAAFPKEALQAHPMLCILQGWTLVLGYRVQNRQKIEELLQQADQAAAALEDKEYGRWLAGQSAAVRTFLGMIPDPRADSAQQLALAARALDLLPKDDPLRSTTTLTVAYAHMAAHDAKAAFAAMEEAKRLSLAGRNYYGVVEAIFHQALLTHNLGKLRRAAEICRQGKIDISTVLADPEHELPAVGSLDIALGRVALEQNQMDEAEKELHRGLDLIGWTFNPYYRLIGCVALFRLREIQGRSEEALAALYQLEEAWPDITFCTQAIRTMHRLRSAPRDPKTVSELSVWAKEFSSTFGEEMLLPGIGPLGASEAYYLTRLVWVRAQIAIGDPKAALEYLDRQLETAADHGLNHRVIELSIAAAQAEEALGENKRAREAIERALTLAEPEGYLRIFDEGTTFTRLLGKIADSGVAQGYIRQITEAIARPVHIHSEQARTALRDLEGLPEPLSVRELEILRLMAHGASNKEIADKLVISVGTVKSHISHILGKLNADNRTKAVARARELGLLEI